MACGIYALINKDNGKKYIGQSRGVEVRFEEHLKQLKNNNHINKRLLNDYNSGYSFDCEIITKCNIIELDKLERYYIDLYDTENYEKGYNLTGKENIKNEIKERMINCQLKLCYLFNCGINSIFFI